MLVLSRRIGDVVQIGETIRVVVVEIRGEVVRLGFEAPPDVQIMRDDAKNREPKPKGWTP